MHMVPLFCDKVAQEFQKLAAVKCLPLLVEMRHRVPFRSIFEMPADLSVGKYPQVVLMVEIRKFPPAQYLPRVAPGHEVVAKTPFLVQMFFEFLKSSPS